MFPRRFFMFFLFFQSRLAKVRPKHDPHQSLIYLNGSIIESSPMESMVDQIFKGQSQSLILTPCVELKQLHLSCSQQVSCRFMALSLLIYSISSAVARVGRFDSKPMCNSDKKPVNVLYKIKRKDTSTVSPLPHSRSTIFFFSAHCTTPTSLGSGCTLQCCYDYHGNSG